MGDAMKEQASQTDVLESRGSSGPGRCRLRIASRAGSAV